MKPFPLVIGTLHSPACLQKLSQRASQEVVEKIDFLEVRLDGLLGAKLLSSWPRPVIATTRHPAEGGAGDLSLRERRNLLEKAILWASAIDVELCSFDELAGTRAQAREKGCWIIASFHDFKTVPSTVYLEELALQAKENGANFLKIAVTPGSKEELEQLVAFQKNSSSVIPTACMGMGEWGKESRLVLANAGAALVYGWLYHPQVPGQWSAKELLQKV